MPKSHLQPMGNGRPTLEKALQEAARLADVLWIGNHFVGTAEQALMNASRFEAFRFLSGPIGDEASANAGLWFLAAFKAGREAGWEARQLLSVGLMALQSLERAADAPGAWQRASRRQFVETAREVAHVVPAAERAATAQAVSLSPDEWLASLQLIDTVRDWIEKAGVMGPELG